MGTKLNKLVQDAEYIALDNDKLYHFRTNHFVDYVNLAGDLGDLIVPDDLDLISVCHLIGANDIGKDTISINSEYLKLVNITDAFGRYGTWETRHYLDEMYADVIDAINSDNNDWIIDIKKELGIDTLTDLLDVLTYIYKELGDVSDLHLYNPTVYKVGETAVQGLMWCPCWETGHVVTGAFLLDTIDYDLCDNWMDVGRIGWEAICNGLGYVKIASDCYLYIWY